VRVGRLKAQSRICACAQVASGERDAFGRRRPAAV